MRADDIDDRTGLVSDDTEFHEPANSGLFGRDVDRTEFDDVDYDPFDDNILADDDDNFYAGWAGDDEDYGHEHGTD